MSEDYARPESLAWQEVPPVAVYQLASRTLRHPLLYGFQLDEFHPAYQVPGRRKDGSIEGEQQVNQLLRPLRAIGRGISELFLDTGSSQSRRGIVIGPPGGMAVRFADAHTRRSEIPWLLWSVYRVVLVEVVGDRLDLLWSGEHQTMPVVDAVNGVLRWQDGSSADLGLGDSARQLFARQRSV
ncbi:hypothetical protein JOF56_009127 [Kibdelosporangium banguiense]|uniref:Uncharacterized protein n=1 Tax=Kibdelosporangium banguiense TaxID=1365924 RepID=A0ABS4TWF9_9PSEU|nr:hypothetical protein [Kibdelosporangium banguiense]MBP2328742.1 hypothetical protein [Kibdelosporangium banguiense]